MRGRDPRLEQARHGPEAAQARRAAARNRARAHAIAVTVTASASASPDHGLSDETDWLDLATRDAKW